MKRVILLFILGSLLIVLVSTAVLTQEEIKIWREFVASLKKDEITVDKIRPYYDFLKEPLMKFLKILKEKVSWEELESSPEIYRVGSQLHFLIPLTFEGQKVTYCFTFLIKDDKWYFQHLESIFIRLDKVSSLPTSKFPDLPEQQKAWMREEIYWSKQVQLFVFLSQEKGKDFAFNWFRDGPGYFLGAKTWVPFVPPPKAFILYLCWEQANLRGNKVTLEKLNDDEAIVIIKSIYFELYKNSAHLKQQISFEDYRKLFETIWCDRANSAGWHLQITYKKGECFFNFKKKCVKIPNHKSQITNKKGEKAQSDKGTKENK